MCLLNVHVPQGGVVMGCAYASLTLPPTPAAREACHFHGDFCTLPLSTQHAPHRLHWPAEKEQVAGPPKCIENPVCSTFKSESTSIALIFMQKKKKKEQDANLAVLFSADHYPCVQLHLMSTVANSPTFLAFTLARSIAKTNTHPAKVR